MKEGALAYIKHLVGTLAIVSIVLGGYYYFEGKSGRGFTYVPIHGETATLFIEDTSLTVEVVGTNETKQRGLSGREILPIDRGMLFLFERSGFHGIWMKDMLFPIDIVWIDENLLIVTIIKDVTPDSFPQAFKPTRASRYVLEVNDGLTSKLGIKIGDKIRFEKLD